MPPHRTSSDPLVLILRQVDLVIRGDGRAAEFYEKAGFRAVHLVVMVKPLSP
jgi:hypothetical protein